MKSIIFLCLAILAISLGATGITVAFMPLGNSWDPSNFITAVVTRHADWPTAKALLFSYVFLFSGIILAIKYISNSSSRS